MKKSNLILIYATILMILSQTEWARYVVFLSIPLLIVLMFRNTRVSKKVFKKLFYLNLIVLLGFVSGIIHLPEYNLYFFGRDIMYFIQAPVFIIIGIYLYKEVKDFRKLLKMIILTSFVITVYNLTELFVDPAIIFRLGLETRYEYHLSNSTAFLAFVILFYAKKLHYRLFQKYVETTILIVSLFSIIISFSRTFYLLLIIILIIPYIYNKRTIFYMYFTSVVLMLFIIFGGLFLQVSSNTIKEKTFESKVTNSLNEIIVHNYNTSAEINNNWRGYEAYLGLEKYYQGNFMEILFGQGFGSYARSPFWIFQGEKLDILPMFHNGYITILLKTGIIGLLLFFLFLWKLLQIAVTASKVDSNKTIKLSGLLLTSSIFVILLQTLVVHGIFKTTVPVLLLFLMGIVLYIIVTEKERVY